MSSMSGAFTDLVCCDTHSGAVEIHKVSATPDDPAEGVLQGIKALCRWTDLDARARRGRTEFEGRM